MFTNADTDVNTDTDDINSPNVFQRVQFLSGYKYADTDTKTWNSGLRHNSLYPCPRSTKWRSATTSRKTRWVGWSSSLGLLLDWCLSNAWKLPFSSVGIWCFPQKTTASTILTRIVRFVFFVVRCIELLCSSRCIPSTTINSHAIVGSFALCNVWLWVPSQHNYIG